MKKILCVYLEKRSEGLAFIFATTLVMFISDLSLLCTVHGKFCFSLVLLANRSLIILSIF
jgi:hypothetical protein